MVLMDDGNWHTDIGHTTKGSKSSLYRMFSFMNSPYGVTYVHLMLNF